MIQNRCPLAVLFKKVSSVGSPGGLGATTGFGATCAGRMGGALGMTGFGASRTGREGGALAMTGFGGSCGGWVAGSLLGLTSFGASSADREGGSLGMTGFGASRTGVAGNSLTGTGFVRWGCSGGNWPTRTGTSSPGPSLVRSRSSRGWGVGAASAFWTGSALLAIGLAFFLARNARSPMELKVTRIRPNTIPQARTGRGVFCAEVVSGVVVSTLVVSG